MRPPLVSYVVPFYNPCSDGRSFTWFAECIQSLMDQDFKECEFIFVDDGSTDCSRGIIEAIARKDERFVLAVMECHRGIEAALNCGIPRARSQYIARLDADDAAYSFRTSTQLSYLNSHPEIQFVGGAIDEINASGLRIGVRHPPACSPDDVRAMVKQRCPFFHPTVMFHKAVFNKIGGYPKGYPCAEDYAFWALALRAGFRGANLAESLIRYRVHDAQESKRHNVLQTGSAEAVKRMIADMPLEEPSPCA